MVIQLKKLLFKKLLSYILFISIICILLGIYTFLYYKNIISYDEKTLYIHTYIIGIILFFLLGLIKGLVIKNNGLLEGLLSSSFVILIILIINLFLNNHFTYFNLIKIICYIIFCSIGGIIGVNLCKNKNN